jgi:hypothetical protein
MHDAAGAPDPRGGRCSSLPAVAWPAPCMTAELVATAEAPVPTASAVAAAAASPWPCITALVPAVATAPAPTELASATAHVGKVGGGFVGFWPIVQVCNIQGWRRVQQTSAQRCVLGGRSPCSGQLGAMPAKAMPVPMACALAAAVAAAPASAVATL